MKTVANVLLILGLIGIIYFGYQAIEASKSFSVLGMDVAVSSADWTPVIISAILLVAGFFLRKK